MSNTLHFHSFAAKRAFVASQKVTASEIVSETPGSITFASFVEVAEFANNVHVFSVTK